MKYEVVKATSENMAVQIFEYIHAAGLTREDRDFLFLEISTSFFTAAVHNSDASEAIKEIKLKSQLLAMHATEGYLKILAGEKDNVLCDLTNYEGENDE